MSDRLFYAFEIGGLGQVPNLDAVLAYGRALAERDGMTVPDDALPRITQRADGADRYRIEIPASYA